MTDPVHPCNRSAGATARPLDARLAKALVRPLEGTKATPKKEDPFLDW